MDQIVGTVMITIVLLAGLGSQDLGMPGPLGSHREHFIEALPSSIDQRDQSVESRLNISPASIFEEVQEGIQKSDARRFSSLFHRQVFVNLRGMEGGYYSANQAYFIVQNFLDARKVVNFRLTRLSIEEQTPYATGGGTFMHRGNREIFQVYVSLTKQNGQWVIAQFSLY